MLRATLIALSAIEFIVVNSCMCIQIAVARDNNVTLREVRSGGHIYVVAHLDQCSDATVTVTASTADNIRSSPRLPLTVDIRTNGDTLVVTFAPIDSTRPTRLFWHYNWHYGCRAPHALSAYGYRLPYHDETHYVTQGPYGSFSHFRGSGNENAIDFLMPIGTTVFPARSGVVVAVRADSNTTETLSRVDSDANYVVIRHDDGSYAEYLHLEQYGVLVHVGQKVTVNDPIARSGNTGYSTEPHLHFAVFNNVDGSTRKTYAVHFVWPNGDTFQPVQGQDY